MKWVFLSPHFDDVVLSCGGMLWELFQSGQPVQVWTVCAGTPAPGEPLSDFAQVLHERWGTGLETVAARKAEDENALHCLKAEARFGDLPDCIYRRLPDGPEGSPGSWLISGEDDLWQPVHPLEEGVVEGLAAWIQAGLENQMHQADLRLVSPLTLGNHVDHALVRAAAERAAQRVGCTLLYYADYPYAVQPETNVSEKTGPGWQPVCQAISTQALEAWQDAVAMYVSQLSTFWSGRDELNARLEDYWRSGGGTCLWQPG
jgi:LmbE family N-acetylglucosaminyl deacetylase